MAAILNFRIFAKMRKHKTASISLTVRDRAISSKFSISRVFKRYIWQLFQKFIMFSCMFLHLIFFNVNYWLNTSPFTFPLCSSMKKLVCLFSFILMLCFCMGITVDSFASLRPVSSRPWPIFQKFVRHICLLKSFLFSVKYAPT